MGEKFSSVDDYILSFPIDAQEKLTEIRELIYKLVPESEDALFYQVPSLILRKSMKPKDGILFAAFKKHIGLYPGPEAINHFIPTLKERKLRYSSETIQFPMNQPLPLDLISEIVKFRINNS